jgi:hypothetical protein
MPNDRAFELRKKIARTVKTMNRLSNERQEMDRELIQIETSCTHAWTEPRLVKGTKDRYEKSCQTCGMHQTSKGVHIKF